MAKVEFAAGPNPPLMKRRTPSRYLIHHSARVSPLPLEISKYAEVYMMAAFRLRLSIQSAKHAGKRLQTQSPPIVIIRSPLPRPHHQILVLVLDRKSIHAMYLAVSADIRPSTLNPSSQQQTMLSTAAMHGGRGGASHAATSRRPSQSSAPARATLQAVGLLGSSTQIHPPNPSCPARLRPAGPP